MNTHPEILRHLRLTADQYMQDVSRKRQVVLHHTVGGSAKSTFEYWQSTTDRVGTAYVVDRRGEIYEVFDPHYWAHHLGLRTANNRRANMESIGIELASEGALRTGQELNEQRAWYGAESSFDPGWLYAFDIDADKARPPSKWFTRAKKLYQIGADADKYYDHGVRYRDYRYFDRYDPEQIFAARWLVQHLCAEFSVPLQLPAGDLWSYRPELVDEFEGIVHHAQVRADKSDLHPGIDLQLFVTPV